MRNPVLILFSLCIFILETANFASSANILIYGVVGSYSQRISMWSLVEGLSDKGHNITFLSPYDSKDPHPRIFDYAPKKWKAAMGPWEEHMSFYDIRKNNQMAQMWFDLPNVGILACQMLYSDDEFVSWVKSSKFHLVIVDGLMNECVYSMVHFWKSKLIMYSTTSAMSWYTDQHGLPDESGSVPDIMYNFEPGRGMTFLKRFVNAITPIVWLYYRDYWYLPKLEKICKDGLGLTEIPSFNEIEKNTSLVFLTNHHSISYPRSMPPNAVAIGGVAVAKNLKPLPEAMQKFIEAGKNGFIFISFGTVAEFVNFDKTVQQEFIRGISSFPEIQFVWKSTFEIDLPIPKNVLVTPWAPQQSLLAHPKIKAFISHSGMGSTTESIHFSVPVISCPVLAEQDMNGAFVSSKGAGIKLEITELKQKDLEHAIKEVVYNPRYSAAMKRLQRFFQDRPMTATETSIWWTEFILRHEQTNDFLRPPSTQQAWWVRRQIDVWLVATVLALIILSIPISLMYIIAKKIFSNSHPLYCESESDKKNN